MVGSRKKVALFSHPSQNVMLMSQKNLNASFIDGSSKISSYNNIIMIITLFFSYLVVLISMTSLLMHTIAHSTSPSFRPKINNQPLKKFLSLVVSWIEVVKNGKILTFFVNLLCQKLSQSFKKNFIEEYDFRGTLFVIDIFWKLQFLNHFIF